MKNIIRICTAIALIICTIPSSQALMSQQNSNEPTLTCSGLSKAFQFSNKPLEPQQKMIFVYKIAMHQGLTKHKIGDEPYLDEINGEVSQSDTYKHKSGKKEVKKSDTKNLTVKEMLQRLKKLSRNPTQ